MSTWPLASWAGLRRTCTVIQLSRGQVALADLHTLYRRRPVARRSGGHLREETHALAERPRLDLEEGAGVARRPNLDGILLDLVDDSPAKLTSRNRNVLRP